MTGLKKFEVWSQRHAALHSGYLRIKVQPNMERTHSKKNNYMLNIMRPRSVEYNNLIVHVQKCHMLRHMMAMWLVLANVIPESVSLDAVYRCPITLVCYITA